jgi:hypothetical protein
MMPQLSVFVFDKKNKHTIYYHDNKAKNSLTDVIGSMGMLSVEVYGL